MASTVLDIISQIFIMQFHYPNLTVVYQMLLTCLFYVEIKSFYSVA